MTQIQPALFVPHGAPTFALRPGAAGAALSRAAGTLTAPRAIVIVSAHWDTTVPTVGFADRPETIHDFYGFPEALYALRYPATGCREAAEQVVAAIRAAGLPVEQDARRGLDHGAWVPLLEARGIAVAPRDWRRAAHKCADAIYARLSGESPFFDSRIAYIAESGPKNRRIKRLAQRLHLCNVGLAADFLHAVQVLLFCQLGLHLQDGQLVGVVGLLAEQLDHLGDERASKAQDGGKYGQHQMALPHFSRAPAS